MILVTGANGFIGRQVCQKLLAQGQDIVALDRDFGTSLNALQVHGDLNNSGFLSELFHQYSFDAIIHLAAILNSASRQRPFEAMNTNIGTGLHLLDLAARFHVAKFVFGSSISTYGPKRYEVHGEVSETEAASPNNIYGVSKRYVEIVGEQLRKQDNLQFVALRISMVVGAGATKTASRWRSEIFEKLNASHQTFITMPFASTEFLPLVHVSDVADMIHQLVEAKQTFHEIYNTPSDNWQGGELADYIRSLNRNIEFSFIPSPLRGDPEAINGKRLVDEFGYTPSLLREQLRRYIEPGKS